MASWASLWKVVQYDHRFSFPGPKPAGLACGVTEASAGVQAFEGRGLRLIPADLIHLIQEDSAQPEVVHGEMIV